jgi:hypothetical protein
MSSLSAPPCYSKAHLLLHFLAPHTAHLDCKEGNSAWQHKPFWAALQDSGKCYIRCYPPASAINQVTPTNKRANKQEENFTRHEHICWMRCMHT